MQSFANFSSALYGGTKKPHGVIDYSRQDLSISDDARQQVSCTGRRVLAQCCPVAAACRYSRDFSSIPVQVALKCLKVGTRLEEAFGCPQDIEGAFVGKELYVVQTRPF